MLARAFGSALRAPGAYGRIHPDKEVAMPNPNAVSPVDPQVLTLFQEELARAAALPGVAATAPALWPRFAGYYQGLTRLPRRLRRALQRRWRRWLGASRSSAPSARRRPWRRRSAWAELHPCRRNHRCQQRRSHRRLFGGQRRRHDHDHPPFGGTQTLTAVNNTTYVPPVCRSSPRQSQSKGTSAAPSSVTAAPRSFVSWPSARLET